MIPIGLPGNHKPHMTLKESLNEIRSGMNTGKFSQTQPSSPKDQLSMTFDNQSPFDAKKLNNALSIATG